MKLPWLLLLPRSWLHLDAGFSPLCWGCGACPLLSLWPGKLESVLVRCYDRRKNRPGVRSHSRPPLTGTPTSYSALRTCRLTSSVGKVTVGSLFRAGTVRVRELRGLGSVAQLSRVASGHPSPVCATSLPCRPPGSPWRASSHSPAAGSETDAGPPQLPAPQREAEHRSCPPEHCLEGPVREGGCGQVLGGGWQVLHTCNTFPQILPFLPLSNGLRADGGERCEVTFKLANLSSSPQRLVWERDAINLKNTVVFIFKNMIRGLQSSA